MIGIDAKADACAHQRSEGGRLAVLEAVDRTAKAIGLHLVEKIEPGQPPGDSDLSDSADERIDGLQALAHLDRDPLEDRARNIAAGALQTHSEEHPAGVGAPVRGSRSLEMWKRQDPPPRPNRRGLDLSVHFLNGGTAEKLRLRPRVSSPADKHASLHYPRARHSPAAAQRSHPWIEGRSVCVRDQEGPGTSIRGGGGPKAYDTEMSLDIVSSQ